MKALYQVSTKHRRENADVNWASYNVIARGALEAIKKATPKFTFKGLEYACEVKLIGKID